jgi:hypothetical protein
VVWGAIRGWITGQMGRFLLSGLIRSFTIDYEEWVISDVQGWPI